MHQVGVVGLSYRHAGVDEVARFSLPRAEVGARLPLLRDGLGAGEVLYLGTCNRVEVLYTTADGQPATDARREVFRALTGREAQAGEASRILRAWTGEAALEHLFLVACGLDSAQAGEHEIALQIRGAWEISRAVQVCGPVLDRLVGEALGMARRVHRLESGVRPPSLADLAADRVLAHFGTSPPRGSPPPVALIGVSPMTRRCGLLLHRAGVPVVVVNRTLEVAGEFAQAVSGRALSLEQYRASPAEAGALVLAAGGGEPILDAADLSRLPRPSGRAPLLIDFGVPPNVDPRAARAAGLLRIGMNDMIETAQEKRIAQLLRLAPVRAAIDERLAHLRTDLATRAVGRKLADLRDSFEQIAADEAERALAAELRDLDASQQERLQRFAGAVARRLAHLPLAGLRAAAEYASADALDAFFREARLRRSGPASSAHSPGTAPRRLPTHDQDRDVADAEP